MLGVEVFSYGGCGTNYLRRLIISGSRTNKSLFTEDQLRMRVRQRVHQRIPPLEGYRLAIYVYGDPAKSVDSMLARKQFHTMAILAGDFRLLMRQRTTRMGRVGFMPNFERNTNILKLEEHYDNWRNSDRPYDIMFVNYDSLTSTNFKGLCAELAALGVELNEKVKNNFKPRNRSVRPFMRGIITEFNQTHATLVSKIKRTPPYELKRATK